MHIPIHSTNTKIPNLAEIQRNLELRGGSVIEYRRMLSLMVFSLISPQYEWIERDAGRVSPGLKHVAFSFLLGWWSPMGLLANLSVILFNLSGGVDVTPLFLPAAAADSEAMRLRTARMELERKRRQRVHYVVLTASILALIFLALRYA